MVHNFFRADDACRMCPLFNPIGLFQPLSIHNRTSRFYDYKLFQKKNLMLVSQSNYGTNGVFFGYVVSQSNYGVCLFLKKIKKNKRAYLGSLYIVPHLLFLVSHGFQIISVSVISIAGARPVWYLFVFFKGWYMCLKTENCYLKIFVKIRMVEKVHWNM